MKLNSTNYNTATKNNNNESFCRTKEIRPLYIMHLCKEVIVNKVSTTVPSQVILQLT